MEDVWMDVTWTVTSTVKRESLQEMENGALKCGITVRKTAERYNGGLFTQNKE